MLAILGIVHLFINIDILGSYIHSVQAQERFYRWMSFEGLFPQVSILGYGLGAHGPSFQDSFNFVLGEPRYNTEFHNTFLDFSSQFGLLFSLIIFGLYLMYLFKMNTKETYIFLSLAIATFVMSFFHMYARHPLFWLILLLPLIYKYKKSKECVE